MNVKSISRTVGLILLITGIFQLFPLLIAVIDHEPRNIPVSYTHLTLPTN